MKNELKILRKIILLKSYVFFIEKNENFEKSENLNEISNENENNSKNENSKKKNVIFDELSLIIFLFFFYNFKIYIDYR